MKSRLDSSLLCQFRAGDSPVHRIGAGKKLVFTAMLSAAAFGAREPLLLLGLGVTNLAYYSIARLKWLDFWHDVRLFLLQTVIVVLLYVVRDGLEAGAGPGIRTGLQILFFFMPFAVFMRTTSTAAIMKSMQTILPRRVAFFTFTSFRFIPFFAREIREISQAQRLRGARITPRDLANPHNWSDIFHCLMIPLIVRALKTAQDAALSAEARGLGRR
ncbi:MAG: energy-coupling factor transporter transmembrane protein EcfT [Syntrophaceae bacterium]|nr:energy-coupling factor transporter transmembrane protein EcfT [Syntrophaceae bacterium]